MKSPQHQCLRDGKRHTEWSMSTFHMRDTIPHLKLSRVKDQCPTHISGIGVTNVVCMQRI